MGTHEHQWVFAAEVVIPTAVNAELGFKRLEYCVVCGAFRIDFSGRWRYWYSEATKRYLDGFSSETHNVIDFPAVASDAKRPSRSVLGRGLLDIAKLQPITYLHRLLKP